MSFLKTTLCVKKKDRKGPSKNPGREEMLIQGRAVPSRIDLLSVPGHGLHKASSSTSLSIQSSSDPSFTLSRFQIEKKIGKGQFSEVFHARDRRTGSAVALKKISIFEMMDAKTRLDCYKEINLLQQLDHPNIIKHIGYFISSNDLYIILELAGGGDLSRLLSYFSSKGTHLSEGSIWKFFSQVSDALAHMHEKRVMHRDIKPANIFVTSDGVPKLGDLGLGRFFSNRTQDAHSLVGTPYYMSPERIKESGYDFKSDIWSMGCLLYEMAALQSPFFGEKMNLYSLCKKIESVNYPPLPADKYSDAISTVVAACLQPDPEKRPQAKVIADIARVQFQKHYVSSRPSSMSPSTGSTDSSSSTASYSKSSEAATSFVNQNYSRC